ncbi:Hypothetical predicted protein, partial [Pelobates cultripes]
LNTPGKRSLLLRDLKKERVDTACVQETHFKRDHTPSIYNKYYPTQFHALSDTKTKGVSIFIHKDTSLTLHRKIVDPKGRFIILVGMFNNTMYTLAAAYFPNIEPKRYLQTLILIIDE